MLKLLKYEFRKCRTLLLTLLAVTAVLEGYFLISLRLVSSQSSYENHLAISIGLLVLVLLVFGLVRALVKRVINGILAQPSDALFGFLIGAAFGALVAVAWAWSGLYLEYSVLATLIAGYLG